MNLMKVERVVEVRGNGGHLGNFYLATVSPPIAAKVPCSYAEGVSRSRSCLFFGISENGSPGVVRGRNYNEASPGSARKPALFKHGGVEDEENRKGGEGKWEKMKRREKQIQFVSKFSAGSAL